MNIHPLCLLLPAMTRHEYGGLVADIKGKGLIHPIVTYEGMVLDGRHRLSACEQTGVTPRFTEYAGDDPAGYVASTTQHRSLNTSQRALIAAGFLEYERAQAKGRQARSVPENFPEATPGEARDKAGARMNVSGKTVDSAEVVIDGAVPEILEKVRSGEMALNEATKVVKLNDAAQRKVAAAETKKARRDTYREAVNRSDSAKRRCNPVTPSTEPGTPFTRKILNGLERIAMLCAEDGMRDAQSIATRFMDEMDWKSDALSIQFERCEPVIRALSIIRQHAKAA